MSYVDDVLAKVIAKNPSEPEFHQAVTEVFETIRPLIEANEEEYKKICDMQPKLSKTDIKYLKKYCYNEYSIKSNNRFFKYID